MGKDRQSHIRRRFDDVASYYDQQRRKLIPCFEEFYGSAVSVISCSSENPEVLDIGSGTGLFSSFLLEKYPSARLTLIDLSENMLDVARERFEKISSVSYILGDYLTYSLHRSFDVIISALSIHHHPDREKTALFKKCYDLLRGGGIFVNADQVKGDTAFLEALNKGYWKRKIESSGLTQEEIDSAYDRIKLDRMATMSDQIAWMRQCGFSDVDFIYRNYSFAVFFGRRV